MYIILELIQMNVNNFDKEILCTNNFDKEILCTVMYTYVQVFYFQL